MTEVIEDLNEWRNIRKKVEDGRSRLGFVPTMGNLHAGHLSLMERARKENDLAVVSIFVNPTQFDEASDLDSYPRTLRKDLAECSRLGFDWALVPSYEQLYPEGYRYRVTESEWSKRFCGRHRPGHFDGVLTVVLKLLLLVEPGRAYFGEKDFQQYRLIRDMVEAFFLNVEIVACPTVRDSDGLALSSRNSNLDEDERRQARRFPEILAETGTPEQITEKLRIAGFHVDYVEDFEGRRLAAVRIGNTRLIDNLLKK